MKKALPWLVTVLVIFMMAIQWLQLTKLKTALKESDSLLVAKMHAFDKSLGRAETMTDVNGSILKELRDGIPEDIKEELEGFGAELQSLATATLRNASQGSGTVTRRNSARRTKPPSSGEPAGLVRTNTSPITSPASEPLVVPEEISFQDWRLNLSIVGDQLDYSLDQKFDVLMVEGSRGGGTATYLRVWELDNAGGRMEPPMEVEDFQVVRRVIPSSGFSWFNPKLEIALANLINVRDGSYEVAPEIGLSFMSYGETADDLSWRILRAGASYTGNAVGLSFSPVSYNLGKELPLVSNVWLSPTYTWLEADHWVGLSLGGSL
tara:strand:+ start:4171 stop:5136 length:966 start_codon:yes stop_codon:yes gene_type:complete